MKKKTKILAITGGICAGVGIVFLAAGIFVGGGRIDWDDAFSVRDADVRRLSGIFMQNSDNYSDGWYDDIDNLDPERWDCTAVSGIKDLDIDLSAGYLEIKQYEGREIQVYVQQNDRKTKIKQDGKELTIERDNESWFGKNSRAVKILIPETQIFDEVDIELKAMESSIDSMKANELNVSAAAASLEVTGEIQASESEWSIDAGELEVNCLVSRTTAIDGAAADIQVNMKGSQEDYFMDGEVNMGELLYGDQEWDDLKSSVQYGKKTAKNHIKVECSASDMQIEFTE